MVQAFCRSNLSVVLCEYSLENSEVGVTPFGGPLEVFAWLRADMERQIDVIGER